MKKEVLLAISIGFILGLIITFGIYTANKSLKSLPTSGQIPTSTPPANQPTSTPAPTLKPGEFSLTITEPADEALVTQNSLVLKGKTASGAVISVLSETSQTQTTANDSGDFSATISLEGGFNRITVTAYDKDGKTASQSLMVTYTTAQL